jgi:hypothetical protein
MKSVNVFILFIMRPWSCHFLPSSPPPRMYAVAQTTPRSTRLKMFELNGAELEYPYEPYA